MIDYGFPIIVTDLNEGTFEELETLPDQGVTSYKLMMAYKDVLMVDDATLFKVMQLATRTGQRSRLTSLFGLHRGSMCSARCLMPSRHLRVMNGSPISIKISSVTMVGLSHAELHQGRKPARTGPWSLVGRVSAAGPYSQGDGPPWLLTHVSRRLATGRSRN